MLAISLIKQQEKKNIITLPILGNPGHTVGDFSFTNQLGESVTAKNVENKIYVADFFFTTCTSICPIMTSTLEHVASAYPNNENVKFISHTVDPEIDSVSVLLAYAKKHNANNKQWYFVTGDKKQLYQVAREMYLLPNIEPGDGGQDDFIHSQYLVLVDKKKQIRGFYDGTSINDEKKLIVDIANLLNEN